jgi:hypothetical protein
MNKPIENLKKPKLLDEILIKISPNSSGFIID